MTTKEMLEAALADATELRGDLVAAGQKADRIDQNDPRGKNLVSAKIQEDLGFLEMQIKNLKFQIQHEDKG